MKCEYGLCLLCNKDLMSSCGTCGHKKPNGNYTEVRLELNNKTKMPIAVCLGCKDKIWTADKKEIMKAVREGWSREHDKLNWTQEKRDSYWKTYGESVLELI